MLTNRGHPAPENKNENADLSSLKQSTFSSQRQDGVEASGRDSYKMILLNQYFLNTHY